MTLNEMLSQTVAVVGAVSLKIDLIFLAGKPCDKWVPVTTAWRVLRFVMEERPPIWRVAANILTKQSVADSRRGVVLQLGDWARC